MSNWDNFPPDDDHHDPGDDGLINNDNDLPPEILWGEYGDNAPWNPELSYVDDISERFPELYELMGDYGISFSDIGYFQERGGFPAADDFLGAGGEVRGTVYSTPEDALRAIIDAGIVPIGFIVETEDGFSVGVLYDDVT